MFAMANLFNKAILFTDIHFGLKSNSLVHNSDCEEFVSWAIDLAKKEGCETGFFLGDWHHHRASLNLQTMNFSLRSLERLSQAFDQFFFIPGNHDLYYRDKRDIHSVEWARHLPNIQICNDFVNTGDVVIAPWLVGDDYKKIQKMSARYMFGHFELPHFKMNAMVEMPDHGELRVDNFGGFDQVFSGHFHLRQKKRNVNYIGNCFPHNFSDAGDDKRGATILSWGSEPEYHAWPGQPLYRLLNLSQVIDNHAALLSERMHVRVQLDIEISYEEASYIKDTFIQKYNLREMALIPTRHNEVSEDMTSGEIQFESVDQIVIDQLTRIESEFYDPKLLLHIYNTL
jgi:DNA repair exonuclease SbcCD nuclease subunit